MLEKNAESTSRTVSRPNNKPKGTSSFKNYNPPVTKDDAKSG